MQVYLVYSPMDDSLIRRIAHAMLSEDIAVWFDFPGDSYFDENKTYEWMRASDLIVVIWTKESIRSDYVQRDWKSALRTDRRIIAVKVGDINLPEIPDTITTVVVRDLDQVPSELSSFVKSISRYKIFISYSRKDRGVAQQLVRLIHRSPHQVWIDESGIDPGQGFPEKIIQAISQSDYLLLLWSKNSKASRWVEREWNYAYKESKNILPLLLDKTPLPMALETINAFTSLDDKKLYRFLSIKSPPKQANIFVKVISLIKAWFKNAA